MAEEKKEYGVLQDGTNAYSTSNTMTGLRNIFVERIISCLVY